MIARCILKLTGRHEATCVVRKGRVIGWRRAETRSETTGQELHACRARLWMVDLLLDAEAVVEVTGTADVN
jgi:hypothetical protein